MGKFILCTGELAKVPYCFQLTRTDIYSLEELGYYLYHNIYTITMEVFEEKLFTWLQYELKMVELAEKCRRIIKESTDIKDIVVTILCATDYFSRKELENLIKTVDMINGLSAIEKQRIKADNYLKYGDYESAIAEYQCIIRTEEAASFSPKDYGNILHNLSVAYVQVKAFERAKDGFQKAYSLNENEESLKEYFFLLKLLKQEEEFLDEALRYNLSMEKVQSYISELDTVLMEAEEDAFYKKIVNLSKLKEAGKVGDYYYTIDTIIFDWKQKYKYGME